MGGFCPSGCFSWLLFRRPSPTPCLLYSITSHGSSPVFLVAGTCATAPYSGHLRSNRPRSYSSQCLSLPASLWNLQIYSATSLFPCLMARIPDSACQTCVGSPNQALSSPRKKLGSPNSGVPSSWIPITYSAASPSKFTTMICMHTTSLKHADP